MERRVYIGIAWPYANGSLHLGHAASFIGADVLARYHRLAGDHVLMTSGSDCYGTPIAVEADNRGVHPSEIVENYHQEFERCLIDKLGFSYDLYTRTDTDQHAKVVQDLFLDLYNKGFLYKKTEKALYSPFLKRFLPDRYIEGICPECGFDSARGDQCDNCGTLLDPISLKEPKINPKVLKNEKELKEEEKVLEVRDSEHFYLKLTSLQKDLEKFVNKKSGGWRSSALGFTNSFLNQGLQDRAVTRDTEWGVPLPLTGYDSKRIYVWFDAVTGYLSSSKKWAEEKGDPDLWKKWWQNKEAIHYYVHGKDNVPFHTIIWPGILLAEGSLNTPDRIVSSEYLNLEGKQFSKSRNWAVWLPDLLESFNPETVRYFLIYNGPENSDVDFYWSEFAQRVNGELIGTFGNLVNRVLSFSKKNFPEGVRFPKSLDDDSKELLDLSQKSFEKLGKLIEKGKFRAGFKVILEIAETANRYIDKKEPWAKIKDESKRDEVESELAVLIQTIRVLSIIVNPFLPKTSEKIHEFLGFKIGSWEYPEPEELFKVLDVSPLYKKIEDEEVEREVSKLGKK